MWGSLRVGAGRYRTLLVSYCCSIHIFADFFADLSAKIAPPIPNVYLTRNSRAKLRCGEEESFFTLLPLLASTPQINFSEKENLLGADEGILLLVLPTRDRRRKIIGEKMLFLRIVILSERDET